MWDWDGRGGGLSAVWHWILGIFWGVGHLLALLVFLGLLFLLVRFLIVATRAAHLYIARNSPPAPPAARPAPARPATRSTSTTTRTTPTRRTPKPPTT